MQFVNLIEEFEYCQFSVVHIVSHHETKSMHKEGRKRFHPESKTLTVFKLESVGQQVSIYMKYC